MHSYTSLTATALPLRPASAPQCLTCLRRYAQWSTEETSALRQQIRGKKKMVNNSSILTVRLRKDMNTFGRKGALVPIPRGFMRNRWYPEGVAEYVTASELKHLRNENVSMERDFLFSTRPKPVIPEPALETPSVGAEELRSASAFQKKPEIEKISPQRSLELIEMTVRSRLDFFRQPILEEKPEVETPEPATPEPARISNFGSGAAADLFAARRAAPLPQAVQEPEKRQAIYGSVSTLDVLQAIRAAMAENDEAKRVVLAESDVSFVGLEDVEGDGARVVKHVGDFEVEVRVRGSEGVVKRTVRVVPQEL